MTDYYTRKSDGVRVQADPAPLWPEHTRVLPEWRVDTYPDGDPVLAPKVCPVCEQYIASVLTGEGEAAEVRFLPHDVDPLIPTACRGSGQLVPEDAPTTPETAGVWLPNANFAEEYASA